MIAGSYALDLLTDLFHKTGSLMTQYDRDLCGIPVVHHVYVCVINKAIADAKRGATIKPVLRIS